MTKLFTVLAAILASFALLAPRADAQEPDNRGIDIEIRGGLKRALIPIAIPPLKSLGGGDATIAAEVRETITRDLQISGYFSLIPEDAIFFDLSSDGLTPTTINFENWSNIKASGLVKGGFKEASGQVVLDMRLFLVDKQTQANLKWEPKAVGRDQLRREAHEFADALIEYYTGNRGIFGTRITFTAKGASGQKNVYMMDMDGANLRRLTNNDSINILPTFGNGGVYYTSYKDGNPNLYLWRGGSDKLVSSQPGQNSGAAFCKGKLAVTLSQGGTNTDIYLIDPNTGAIQSRLTDHWGIDTSPTWSPDCARIAFVSDRAGNPQIYVMNADGSDPRRLTHQGTYNTNPDWSPQGDRIVFSARDERGAFDIFTVDLGGAIERLTQNQGSNEDPSFSPNGRYIVFVSSRGGAGPRIYIMREDGSHQVLITQSGSGFSSPQWAK